MQYYNDLPRFLEAISDGHIEQNSVFAWRLEFAQYSFRSGMYQLWRSEARESP
jgi:hypothetical protein